MFYQEQYFFAQKWKALFSNSSVDFSVAVERYSEDYSPEDLENARELVENHGFFESTDAFRENTFQHITAPNILLDLLFLCCDFFQDQPTPLPDAEVHLLRQWFLSVLDRVVYLTCENMVPFSGTPQKIQLTSQKNAFHCSLEPWEDLRQVLTVERGGNVSFRADAYSQLSTASPADQPCSFHIETSVAQTILQEIAAYFSTLLEEDLVLDTGDWSVDLTNTDGQIFRFSGSMWQGENAEQSRLSNLIRTSLGMSRLFALDEDDRPENALQRLVLTYAWPLGNISEEYRSRDDQKETLVIDARSQSIELSTNCGGMYTYTRCELPQEVTHLLNQYSKAGLFQRSVFPTSDLCDLAFPPAQYHLTATYEDGTRQTSTGYYEKSELPEHFASFMKKVAAMVKHSVNRGIFDPFQYNYACRRKDDLLYCSVSFDGGSKTYYYRTDDDSLEEGDDVVVPAGKDNHLAIATIVEMEHFPQDDVPFPIEKTKQILRRCTPEDYVHPGGPGVPQQ